MKKLLAISAVLAAIAGSASAATYSTHVTADPFRQPGKDGLQTRANILSAHGSQAFTGADYSFDLANVGDSVTLDLYKLVHFDHVIKADDLLERPTLATFDFGSLGSVTLSGVSYAVAENGGYAIAKFAQGATLNLGNGMQMLVSIADTVFGANGGGWAARAKGTVRATFTLASAGNTPAPVPLPASMPLALGGLGALGLIARRRKA